MTAINRENFAKTPAELIQRTLDTFGPNGENWTQGFWGKSATGEHVGAVSPKAECFCAEGAMLRGQFGVHDLPSGSVGSGEDWELNDQASRYVREAMKEILNVSYLPTIISFNDSPGRTFPEVKAVFERALELAKEAEVAVG